MEGIIKIKSNGSTCGGKDPLPLDTLFAELRKTPLESWSCRSETIDTANYFGNFVGVSHVFDIETVKGSLADEHLELAMRQNWVNLCN